MTKLWTGLALLALSAGGLAWWGTKHWVDKPEATAAKATQEKFLAWNANEPGVVTTASGLQYLVLDKGEGGKTPTDEDMVAVGYAGKLQDGKEFDANPQATFPVKGVVPGFSEALKLMPRKSKFRVWIPSALGYGASPPPGAPIPPNALLTFDIEMHEFKSVAEVQAMQQMMQQMQAAEGKGGKGGAEGALPPGAQ